MPTKHFAYPNVDLRLNFIGCGRYAAFGPDEQPDEKYKIAEPNAKADSELEIATAHIRTAASLLVPGQKTFQKKVHEKRDPSSYVYTGSSLGLAYLLALISRTEILRSKLPAGDIWCTGKIGISDKEGPVLEAVGGFEEKLEAFLDNENQDLLFIGPVSNMKETLT